MDKVTGQSPQITTFFEETGEPKRVSNRGPSAYQPNALPLGQTGSLDLLDTAILYLIKGTSARCLLKGGRLVVALL